MPSICETKAGRAVAISAQALALSAVDGAIPLDVGSVAGVVATPLPGVGAEVLACDVVVAGVAGAADIRIAVPAVPAMVLVAVLLGGAVALSRALSSATAAPPPSCAARSRPLTLTLPLLAPRSTPRPW